MPYDPDLPADGSEMSAAEMRAQLNALNDKIDAIPAGPPGPAGADGAEGPQGPPGPMPPLNPLIAPGRIIADNGDLTLATSDPNGSSETSLIHATDTNSGAPIPTVTAKVGGGTIYSVRVDFAGIVDGAGSPSTPHGALLIYDSASALWKPTLGATQTLIVGDGSGGTHTLTLVGGLIISVT